MKNDVGYAAHRNDDGTLNWPAIIIVSAIGAISFPVLILNAISLVLN